MHQNVKQWSPLTLGNGTKEGLGFSLFFKYSVVGVFYFHKEIMYIKVHKSAYKKFYF